MLDKNLKTSNTYLCIGSLCVHGVIQQYPLQNIQIGVPLSHEERFAPIRSQHVFLYGANHVAPETVVVLTVCTAEKRK